MNKRNDLISRQALIEHLRRTIEATSNDGDYNKGFNDGVDCAASFVGTLPSAQSEPLTDKERRIFLAVMTREEKVCKQIEDEYKDCREYEDSLVYVCSEIRRKVIDALWT